MAECARPHLRPLHGDHFGHPGGGDDGHDRSNYTLQSSSDGGASWRFVTTVEPLGAGYSDAVLLRDGTLAIAFQKTFDPPVRSIEGGGYDLALALVTN